MKMIGLLGGMSWESTSYYYKVINETVREALGGLHSARILMRSLDFAQVEKCQSRGLWREWQRQLASAALGLQQAGADMLVICSNTAHKAVPYMEKLISIPIVHIARVSASVMLSEGIDRVALLGTSTTIGEEFYVDALTSSGLHVLKPEAGNMEALDRIIFQELCRGVISPTS